MAPRNKTITFYLKAIFIIGVFLGVWVLRIIFMPAGSRAESVFFEIKSGESVKEVSARLAKNGLIKSDYWFRTYVWTRDWEKKFKAGNHELRANMNIIEVARVLTAGNKLSQEKQITIIEGWSNDDLGQYLEEQGIGPKKEFLRLVAKTGWQTQYGFLEDKPLDVDVEGYLFPDTYRIYKDATLEEVIKKMLDTFDLKLTAQLRRDIKKRGLNLHEILTLASIVEAEVKGDQDRKKVADVFYKRLKLGMALQADSTVNYVTGKSVASASSKDLKVDSPYNTYKYKGLPPGPISNPGLSAIMAVIYPEPNPYYYFLTDRDGRVFYAKTFEEHVKNKVHL